MKLLLFDQNLSPRLVVLLDDIYPGSQHVANLGLDRASDREVWEFARSNDNIIVTKDADLSELSLLFGFPPKVLWIRRGNCSTNDIATLLRESVEAVKALADSTDTGVLELF